ncbi:MAG: hypothetical protein ABIR06_13035 [Cyclobacteriaceae bacterium]
MPANNIQSVFLEKVRTTLAPHIALADELAEILSISRDSAYRRIRGETVLSLDEVSAICKHFKMSLDEIISPSSEMVSFNNRFVTEDDFTFEKWLKSIEGNLDMIHGLPQKEMILSTKDVPILYYFKTGELSAFKMFFWLKSILRYRAYHSENYNPERIPKELLALGNRIYEKFTTIPRTELWSPETVHASLRQVEFYYECGFFTNPHQARHLCDELLKMVLEIKDCAAQGGLPGGGSFQLFKNELLIADNTFLFKMADKHVVFINHNTLNILSTTQKAFCIQTENYLRNLLNKATKISGTGEKERLIFFNSMEDKIKSLKHKIT